MNSTSVPPWVHASTFGPLDPTAQSGAVVLTERAARHPDGLLELRRRSAATVLIRPDREAAADAVRDEIAAAVVGFRLALVGSAQDCLTLRAAAITAGLHDDEITVTTLDLPDDLLVECVHCLQRSATRDPQVTCGGCARTLIVHPHVSRRRGVHLGYMVDAEEQVRPA